MRPTEIPNHLIVDQLTQAITHQDVEMLFTILSHFMITRSLSVTSSQVAFFHAAGLIQQDEIIKISFENEPLVAEQ